MREEVVPKREVNPARIKPKRTVTVVSRPVDQESAIGNPPLFPLNLFIERSDVGFNIKPAVKETYTKNYL